MRKKQDSNNPLHKSLSDEWYTPQKYIDAVYEVLGSIELDPASCEFANKTIKAERFFTIEDDALLQTWKAKTLFLNPPYGRQTDLFIKKLIQAYNNYDVTEAILLVNAVTDRRWFQQLWIYPLCFTNHRIRFYKEFGIFKQPTHGNVFVYFGINKSRFSSVFAKFGQIIAI